MGIEPTTAKAATTEPASTAQPSPEPSSAEQAAAPSAARPSTGEPLRYELRLTDRELFRVFLFGYFKRPFAVFRRFVGFAIIAFGFQLMRTASDDLPAVAGPICIAWGSWFVLHPLLMAWFAVRKRGTRGHVVVEVADDGIAISQEGKRATFTWDRVTEAGKLGDLVWFEIRGAALAAIPLRVVADAAPLLDAFRAHTRWRGPGARGPS